MFKSISIKNWRQFRDVNIEFHERLTVLTGANASGKTSLLNILGGHFGWSRIFVSNFAAVERKRDYADHKDRYAYDPGIPNFPDIHPDGTEVGEIYYSNHQRRTLRFPSYFSHAGAYQMSNMSERMKEDEGRKFHAYRMKYDGIYIPSHREYPAYSPINSVSLEPTVDIKPHIPDIRGYDVSSIFFGSVLPELPPRLPDTSQIDQMKNAIIRLYLTGLDNNGFPHAEQSKTIFREIENVLSIVLPKSIGFKRFIVRIPEVILDTENDEFALEAISGGLASIVYTAWQIYALCCAFSLRQYPEINKTRNIVVVIDEPENHLHPALQKNLLPNFMKAFPNVCFIVATHSPFIVTSVRDSNVYALDYNHEGPEKGVYSRLLDIKNKAASSNEILRDVLGLEHTKPIWAEKQLNEIINRYLGKDISPESMEKLRQEMVELGLGHLFPETICRVVEKKND